MGILEQIAEQLKETNNNLLRQIETLNDKVSLLEYEIKSGNFSNHKGTKGLSLNFSDDDTLNITFASKILGITQTELILLVKKDKINSIGRKKYIFLASELIRYKNGKEQTEKVILSQRNVHKGTNNINGTNKKLINNVISKKELQKLYAKQAV